MDKKILIVLGVLAVVILMASLNGKITGNSFATPSGYNVPRSCTDSDGGNNPYVQGTGQYKGLSSAKVISFTDTCLDAGSLLEHYCDGAVHLTETSPCRCEKGACKK